MKKLLLILLLVPAFTLHAYAEELPSQAAEVFNTREMERGLDSEEKTVSGELTTGSYDAASALSRLWRSLQQRLALEFREGAAYALRLLAIVFLSALATALCTHEKAGNMIEICSACTAAAILTGGVDSLISQTVEAIYRLSDYSRAALPVVFTAAAASGAVGSAGLRYATVSFALEVLMSISHETVIPLIYAFLSLSLSNMLFPHALTAALCRLSKWAATTVMTGTTLAFTVYLSLTGAISGAVDAAAVKTARSVISGALPVVGGMISDASAAILAAAAIVKNCTGAFGLISVAAICVAPFAALSIRMLMFKAVAAVSDAAAGKRLQTLFNAVGTTAAMLMGLLGCSAVMLFLSFTAAMKAVSG